MCFAIRGLVALFSSPSWVAPQMRHHHRARSLVGPTRTFARYLDRGHYTAIGMIDAKGKQTPQVLVVERGRRIRSDEREMLGSSNWACLYFAPTQWASASRHQRHAVRNLHQWLVSSISAQSSSSLRRSRSAVKVSIGDSLSASSGRRHSGCASECFRVDALRIEGIDPPRREVLAPDDLP